MKLIILVLALLSLISCGAQNSQTKKSMNTFDIKTFKKNKIGSEYNFIKDDTIDIRQLEWEDEYEEIIKTKNSYFEIYKSYYKNGKIKMLVERFPNKFVNFIKEYDENGNLIKETDYDKGFNYTWEDLLKFLKEREIKIIDRNTTIRKDEGRWHVWYVDGLYVYNIFIDGKTGEILQDVKNEFEEGS